MLLLFMTQQDPEFFKKLSAMRFPATLSPFEVMVINIMRKREYPKFGQMTIYFQDSLPKRFEFVDSTLLLDSDEGQSMLKQMLETKS
jgi:hypothetical protein